jgi:hypothetical protein
MSMPELPPLRGARSICAISTNESSWSVFKKQLGYRGDGENFCDKIPELYVQLLNFWVLNHFGWKMVPVVRAYSPLLDDSQYIDFGIRTKIVLAR